MPWNERLALRAEGSAGALLPRYQRDELGYDRASGGFAVRVALYPVRYFAAQISHGNYFFPASSERTTGRLLSVEGGLRVEAPFSRVFSLVIDGNLGVAFTGNVRRFTFDAGVGLQIRPAMAFAFGPMVRYFHVVQDPRSGYPQDAQGIWGGVELTMRWPGGASDSATPPPATSEPRSLETRDNIDRDHDGVLDSLDECPDENAGDNRDRRRLGCPVADADLDSVPDEQDSCPNVSRGESPHPNRPGCPDHDQDGDGLADHRDSCMDRAQGFFQNPRAPGCPLPDRDADAIPDFLDACPDQVGGPSRERSRHGCAGLVHVDPVAQRLVFDAPVEFASDSAELDVSAEPVLEALVELMHAMPAIARLAFELPARQASDTPHASDDLARQRGLSLGRWFRAHGLEGTRFTGRLPRAGAREPVSLGAQITILRPERVELPEEPPTPTSPVRPGRTPRAGAPTGPQRIPSRPR